MRRELAQVDGSLPITNMRTMTEQVAEALAAQRLMATLSACFAVVATVLAAIGLYGVMAYMVTRRTREIGIRVALGADRGSLLALVMREAGLMTAAGVVVAIPAALALDAAGGVGVIRRGAVGSGEYRDGGDGGDTGVAAGGICAGSAGYAGKSCFALRHE